MNSRRTRRASVLCAHSSGIFQTDGGRVADITDEWMFGDELLAAPILGEGQASRKSTCLRASGSIISAASDMKVASPSFIRLIPRLGRISLFSYAPAQSCRTRTFSSMSENIP